MMKCNGKIEEKPASKYKFKVGDIVSSPEDCTEGKIIYVEPEEYPGPYPYQLDDGNWYTEDQLELIKSIGGK